MALSKVFSYQSWVHAVSGAAGSVFAMTVFYPLDTVRQRLQLEDPEKRKALGTVEAIVKIINEEGIASLYRGLSPTLQSLCISNFVYFYTFHSLKALNGSEGQGALKDLLLASIAGIVNVLSTTPFWVVNTRLKMKGVSKDSDLTMNYDNLIQGLTHVAKTEGRAGLWAGTIPSLMLVSNPALQFMMYELLKRQLTTKLVIPSGLAYFCIGAVAKAFATVMTYPLQLVQTRQRHSGSNAGSSADKGTWQMLLLILKTQGMYGLFRGMETKILQTVLTAALMFSIYEKVAKLVGTLLLPREIIRY